MKKVVVVAYSFPPVGGAGVQRPVKFVKFLREFGWEPIVLTVANPSVPVTDEGLLRDIPPGVAVHRARTFEPSYEAKRSFSAGLDGKRTLKSVLKKVVSSLLLPDLQVLWWPAMAATLVKIIRRERPSCLFVTAPPFSSFVPVVFIASLFRLPAVIDYRDEWAFSRAQLENSVKTKLAAAVDRLLEGYVTRKCAAFTAANTTYVKSLIATYPQLAGEKGWVITNGFDDEDFVRIQPAARQGELITIVYTGTVWKATSLRPFLQALTLALSQAPLLRSRVKVTVYGRIVGEEKVPLEEPSLRDVVDVRGYLEHDRVVEEMQGADLLLLTLSDLPGAAKIITGKAFEYMAAGRHVFAMVPEGETSELLVGSYGNVTVVHPDRTEEAAASLLGLLTDIETVRNRTGNDISAFSRRHLAGRLAQIFDRIHPDRL